ncbi:hypothetical protein [Nocardioides coralli]|uniref:hypothetical protein n=1 Tax=Nocardioides coralli TaxID=2872154 RepID=UPI001CA448D4|nr:hypothetical protein [Nocardioides coralli]QZY30175.1 hypothetical protein K6T13_05715 [Nocardioides coralli]
MPVVALALLLPLVATSCSGDDEEPRPDADPSPSLQEPEEAPTLAVEPVTTTGRVLGRLPRKDRVRVERAVSRVAVRWMDDAFLGGRYPRSGFGSSFAVFTPGARAAARRDLGRMTNKLVGRRVDAVTPTAISVEVDLLAVRLRAVTATAHVDLRFRTTGKVERDYRVAGRLMMTRQQPGWRVFAYDIARGQQGGKPAQKQQQKQDQKQKEKQGRSTTKNRSRGGRA